MARRAVFYLSRAVNHPRWSLAFLKSLVTQRAGADFDLVYFLKGFPENSTDPNLVKFRDVTPRMYTRCAYPMIYIRHRYSWKPRSE